MMKKLTIDEGSFRDPDARVAYLNNSVYRIVYPNGFEKFDFIKRILENKSISEYLIETEEKIAISFGTSYGHDTGAGPDNTEMEPIFSIGKKIGETFIRGEFRGGGKKSLPQKTALSLEKNFGKINGWIAYLVTKNPNQQAENEIAAGISMNLPWPIR